MHTVQDILNVQSNQSFYRIQDKENPYVVPEHLLQNPNIFTYVIDCKTGDMEVPVKQSSTVFGYASDEINDPLKIYDLADARDVNFMCSYTDKAIRFALSTVDNWGIMLQHTDTVIRFKQKGGKTASLRRRCWLNGLQDGIITHTLGAYWVEENTTLKRYGNLTGPDTDSFTFDYYEQFKGVFSRRELEILQRIALGYSNRNIAENLFISIRTVETHRKNMIRKLGAKNTANLIYLAADMGLF